jgi:hypothetical protein
MTVARLTEIIKEMWRERRAIDECIMALEVLAAGRRKRGRPRKRPLPPEKIGSEAKKR